MAGCSFGKSIVTQPAKNGDIEPEVRIGLADQRSRGLGFQVARRKQLRFAFREIGDEIPRSPRVGDGIDLSDDRSHDLLKNAIEIVGRCRQHMQFRFVKFQDAAEAQPGLRFAKKPRVDRQL
jgi:hypothetical protein